MTLRGNHREPLFGSVRDRQVLNQIIADVVARCGVRIHAFCWMSNHLHVLIQIADRPLGNVVQRIAQRYSRYRHQQLDTCGHLFERRYGAKLVDVDAYFLTVLRYVHLNPIKAGITDNPSRYPWSSHRAYAGAELISWLTTSFGWSMFSTDTCKARVAYQQFMQEGENVNEDGDEDELTEVPHPQDSRILGTDDFLSTIPAVPSSPPVDLTLEKLAEAICARHGTILEVLRSPVRARWIGRIRAELAKEAVERHVSTLSGVARFLHRDPSSIGRMLERYDRMRESKNSKAGTRKQVKQKVQGWHR